MQERYEFIITLCLYIYTLHFMSICTVKKKIFHKLIAIFTINYGDFFENLSLSHIYNRRHCTFYFIIFLGVDKT